MRQPPIRVAASLVILLAALALPGQAQEAAPPDQPDGAITVEDDPAGSASRDEAIARRIRDILAELEGFGNVGVSVSAGVVTLGGRVAEPEQIRRLDELVTRVEGVVAIENRVTETTDLGERLDPAVARFERRLAQLVAALPVLLVALAAAFVVAGAGFVLARARQPWDRLAPNGFVADVYRQIVRIAFLLAGLVIAVDILGATALLGTILGAAGLVGLAIGFAVRDTVENFIASVMLSFRQPFRPNDLVEIEGDVGKVIRLTSRATILLSLDGNHIRIPNSTVFKARIVNFTRNNERRFIFDVGVDTETDLAEARALAQETLRSLPFVLPEPRALVWLETMNETGAVLRATAWIRQDQTDFAVGRGEAIRLVKEAIEAAGIGIPDTTYRIRLESPAGAAAEPPSQDRRAPRERSRAPRPVSEDVGTKAEAALEKLVDAERAGTDDLLARGAPDE